MENEDGYGMNERQMDYPMDASLDIKGYGIHKTVFHFHGEGMISISQENPTGHSGSHQVFLSREHVIALATLLKQRERAGIFN